MIVAIDGPAGAGKSTVARQLAERLRFRYLDTGAMYRALTWWALSRGVDLDDTDRVAALARELPLQLGTDPEAPFVLVNGKDVGEPLGVLAREYSVGLDEEGRVTIDGTDVTALIRQSRIDRMVPVVARHPDVRSVMRERQRELAGQGDCVIEGRDIGTVVAPEAEVKVYLVADTDVRAKRRQAERPDIGADALVTDLRKRDASDSSRMQPAEDAVRIDTTRLDVDDVVEQIEALVRARV
jgi:CMP/dCMP kinase